MSNSLWPHGMKLARLFTNSQSLLKLMSIESVMPSNHLTLSPLSPPAFNQSFPASGCFLSWLFTSGGQSIGASVSISVLPMNIQDWFPLGLTGLISLKSKGLSRVFSNTTVQKHQLFGTQSSLWSTLIQRHSEDFTSYQRVRILAGWVKWVKEVTCMVMDGN